MPAIDLKSITSSSPEANLPFLRLSFRERMIVAGEIIRSQTRILFSQKFLWFIGGILIWFTANYFVNYNQDIVRRYDVADLFVAMLEIPVTAIAVFLNMQLVSSEKDNRTLEMMFTTAGSRYKVWIFRVATLNLILLALVIGLSTLLFFTFADVPVFEIALNAFVPAFFAGAMTLYLSIKFRSGFAAGMVSAGILILSLMMADAFDETKYYLFFNPYQVPRRIDPGTWHLWMWQNRIAVIVLGCLFMFGALRGMESRERLLR